MVGKTARSRSSTTPRLDLIPWMDEVDDGGPPGLVGAANGGRWPHQRREHVDELARAREAERKRANEGENGD